MLDLLEQLTASLLWPAIVPSFCVFVFLSTYVVFLSKTQDLPLMIVGLSAGLNKDAPNSSGFGYTSENLSMNKLICRHKLGSPIW